MGSSPRAHLAYGYALGSDNRLDVRERVGDYGRDLTVDWWKSYDDEDYDPDADEDETSVTSQIYRRLFEAIPDGPAIEYSYQRESHVEQHYGVKLSYPGAEGSSGYVLIAVGSEKSVDWDEVMTLDVDELRDRPFTAQWQLKLANALSLLGITPIQDGPRWLVFPSYG